MSVLNNCINAPLPISVTNGGTGNNGPFMAGSVLYSDGTIITQDNANFNWNDANGTFTLTQPSSVSATYSVLVVTSDPAGDHGNGNHIEIAGNPGGGGTIFRTDGGLNDSWLQIYGGDSSGLNSGALFINGNNSTDGDAGGIQTTFGLTSSTFQILACGTDNTLFQVDNNGLIGTTVTASSAVATDGSGNLIASSTTATELSYVHGVTSSIQTQIDALTPGVYPWTVETANTIMASNNGYISNSASQVIFTLPTTASVGNSFRVAGFGSGGWAIQQNASQYINIGIDSTTTGTAGYLASTEPTDVVELICVIADTAFLGISCVGNITIN